MAVVQNVTIVRVFRTQRSLFDTSFVSEFKVFDHSNAWKPFLYLKACFLPALLAGSSCSCARKAMCN